LAGQCTVTCCGRQPETGGVVGRTFHQKKKNRPHKGRPRQHGTGTIRRERKRPATGATRRGRPTSSSTNTGLPFSTLQGDPANYFGGPKTLVGKNAHAAEHLREKLGGKRPQRRKERGAHGSRIEPLGEGNETPHLGGLLEQRQN